MSEKLRVKVSEGSSILHKQSLIKENQTPSLLQCVEEFLKTKESGWKNDKHRAQWHMTLKKYAKPLHHLDVDKVTTNDVLAILQPIWLTKNETASRLRGRIETVLDYSKVMRWRSGENPAVWRGNLKLLLPTYSKRKNVKHHPALPFEELPQFYKLLNKREALVGRLLEFIILTACRSGEARMAKWHEIDHQAEAAYRRSTSVGKRRILMEDWLK